MNSIADQNSPLNTLVVRTAVPTGLRYSDYRDYLRIDFFYSCAYCTMSEVEALGISFSIDHYEPQSIRSDLVNEYTNLMYACGVCNIRKSDVYPPEKARLAGYRFYRADEDVYDEHFELKNLRLHHKTRVGEFTIDFLDLNRAALIKLRNIRNRLTECEKYAAEGIRALRSFPIDRLPSHIKGQARRAIDHLMLVENEQLDNLQSILKINAKSELLDLDPEQVERTKARSTHIHNLNAIYPGRWRGGRKKKSTS